MKRIVFFMLAVFLILPFMSCINNPTGMFYSLENEKSISDGNLDNNLSVGAMTKAGSTLYIAANSVHYLTSDADNWVAAPAPGGFANAICTDIIESGGGIFAVFAESSVGTPDLYSATLDSGAVKGWTKVAIAGIDVDEHVSGIDKAEDGRIFILTQKTYAASFGQSYKYGVYSSADPVSAGMTLTAEKRDMLDGGVLSCAYDGTAHWFVFGRNLYKGVSGSMTEITAADIEASLNDASALSGQGYGGLCYDGSSEVYVTAKEGVILSYNGTKWNTSERLTAPLYGIERFTGGSTNLILAGSSKGYYELNMNASSRVFVSPGSADTVLHSQVLYSSLAISSKVVSGFFADGDAVYALGYNNGLWKNAASADGTRLWSLE